MSEKWIALPLSELVDRVTTRNLAGVDRVFSVSAQQGLVEQETYFNKRVASKNLEGYWVVQPGDYVFNKSYSEGFPLGVVVRNESSQAGVVSPLYVVMRRNSDLVVDGWLDLAFHSSEYATSLQGLMKEGGRAHGALNVKLGDYFTALLPVPPLAVQRRMVDLMAHVDSHLANLRVEKFRAEEMARPLMEGLVDGIGGASFMAMGAVGEFIRGRRFTKADYVSDGLACIHYAQIHTHFGAVAEEPLTFVPAEMRSRLRLARTGDVVIAATSEDMDGLGKATVWLGTDEAAVHDDCYIFRHTLDPIFATYLFFSSWFQDQKQRYAAGTKVTRIAGKDLAAIQVPVPPIGDQISIGLAMRALSEGAAAVQGECLAPGVMEARIPRKDASHGSTTEVPGGASGARGQDDVGGQKGSGDSAERVQADR